MSLTDVLAAATREAGQALPAAPLGTLVVGAPADLLVLDGDPLTDLARPRHPLDVVVAGRWLVRDGEPVRPPIVES